MASSSTSLPPPDINCFEFDDPFAFRLMAELITEIAYGAHRDDEDGGHDYIQMQIELGTITHKTIQGYWVEFFPWSTPYYDV